MLSIRDGYLCLCIYRTVWYDALDLGVNDELYAVWNGHCHPKAPKLKFYGICFTYCKFNFNVNKGDVLATSPLRDQN